MSPKAMAGTLKSRGALECDKSCLAETTQNFLTKLPKQMLLFPDLVHRRESRSVGQVTSMSKAVTYRLQSEDLNPGHLTPDNQSTLYW